MMHVAGDSLEGVRSPERVRLRGIVVVLWCCGVLVCASAKRSHSTRPTLTRRRRNHGRHTLYD